MSVGVATPSMTATTDILGGSPFKPRDAAAAVPASPSSRNVPSANDRLMELRWSNSRSPSKLPSLSDIAARLNVDKDHANEDGVPLSPTKSSSAEGRPRLDLTGRLLPTTNPSSPSKDAARPTNAILAPSSPSKLNSTALGATDGAPLASGSSSPTKRLGPSGLPSLDEIRERMAKKGLTADTTSTNGKENSQLPSPSPSFSLLKFGSGPFEGETRKKRASPPPAIFIPGKEALQTSNNSVIKDESIMRLGTSTLHLGKPASPSRTNSSEPPKVERTILRPGTGSLPPTPSSAVSNFAMSVTSPQPKTHPLQHMWSLYFDSKTFNPSAAVTTPKSSTFPPSEGAQDAATSEPPATPTVSSASWEANLKCLGAYRTVEAFFGTFKTLRRPSQLDKSSNYHIFKDGIKPMWEDPCNADGGKWTLTFRQSNPGLTDRSWMWLVLALVGEELDDNDEVTGAVCSLRPRGDRISVWLRSKNKVDRVNQIGRKVLQLLELENEPGVTLEFGSNTGAPLEGPSKFISVQNPVTPGATFAGSSAAQRRQTFQGSVQIKGALASPNGIFQQPLRSPQPLPNGGLQQQQQQAGPAVPRLSPDRSPERRGTHPLPRNPSPGSLGSSLGVQLGSSMGGVPGFDQQQQQQQQQRGMSPGGGRFGPPLSVAGAGAMPRSPLVRTPSSLIPNPNLPMKVQAERMAT
ncbi:uncharacterized protein PFL1_02827 [Pseudozyma flocculosa PF-1]|uniref:Uncharacterized protein n=2 Tax=Pseudozyma flocculosa TaxID=84751 RepID=A0A5C3F171_9BASI|nr:uncharacterized protein PFL1_02827 [Pseudozyma flocculosa PF-1]EPQ29608.1 hypothetical protein PFL1_02827 [Pseudozyma flocculosa PF-1]SPO38168.1 uncharacterized protein PSFLO_03645 [Pseudozyma flocculosa]